MPNATILTFDVEEHHRIEAAVGMMCPEPQIANYRRRAEATTRKLLGTLANANCLATFFIVGELAVQCTALVRDIHTMGHEVASHGWDHRPATRLTPAEFRDDITRCKDALEQIIGAPVFGYRAPTFSVMQRTAWAIDELLEAGYTYDSSIFPVRHDRYGVVDAPTKPFRCFGQDGQNAILEIPPLTLRTPLANLPIAGGGYFRLFPLWLMKAGILLNRSQQPSVSMLYFHPWEFDPTQPKLPLQGTSRFRTYVGIGRAEARLKQLLRFQSFTRFRRAIDVANELKDAPLPQYHLNPTKINQISDRAQQALVQA